MDNKNNYDLTDSIARDMDFINIIEACRDSSGKIDSDRTVDMAQDMGYTSQKDFAVLNEMIQAKDAINPADPKTSSNLAGDCDMYVILPGMDPVHLYDASKDSWGVTMLKYILVIVLCVGAFALIFITQPNEFCMFLYLGAALVMSVLLLNNADRK